MNKYWIVISIITLINTANLPAAVAQNQRQSMSAKAFLAGKLGTEESANNAETGTGVGNGRGTGIGNGRENGTGIGNGTEGAEKSRRIRVKDDLEIALLSPAGRGSDRIALWGTSLAFLVEQTKEAAKKRFDRGNTAAANEEFVEALNGMQDSLKHYPSISGAHTPNLIRSLVKFQEHLSARLINNAAPAEGLSAISPRTQLARYRLSEKILDLILDVEKHFDQQYIIPEIYKPENIELAGATSLNLTRFQNEFASIMKKKLSFFSAALVQEMPDGSLRNEAPYSMYLHVAELVTAQVIDDLGRNLYGYSNAGAVLRLKDLNKRLMNFNLKNDRDWWENSKEAFEDTHMKLKEIQKNIGGAK